MSEFNLKDKIKDWNQRELVKFSLFCCYKIKHLMNKEALELVELVERWLEDENSVSNEELEKAINAGYNVSYTTAYYAAYYATYATVNVANAAYYATYATVNVANAANATYNAVYYAANTAVSGALFISQESLYLDYMRDKLSNIMEG